MSRMFDKHYKHFALIRKEDRECIATVSAPEYQSVSPWSCAVEYARKMEKANGPITVESISEEALEELL